ncbi:MAG: sugar ABC transporter permease [Salana multivorans]|uniref:carbohydrate ABC transporter permease n=1 Tax=Salana multivorans TaxID=120377 RepID=UPI00095B7546|nr:sugar ABC transporter permease [Salana multivorans]MBN8882029.1 sugar ABC transporter permease [Salana multivorans]OJX95954.1 MAG: ABC transporter permease [Micrococcales bacterium 73-15]
MRRFARAVPFIGPHFVIFVTFALLPTVYGFYIAFTRWNIIGDPQFVGLDNFREILLNSDSPFAGQFRTGLLNTLLFVVVSVPLLVVVPLLLALVLSRKDLRGVGLFQAIFYVPGLISVSAGALAWSLMFNREVGLINNVLGSNIAFSTTQPWAWVTIFTLTVWAGIGGNLIIYRSAIAGVPHELHEAAQLDGAGGVRRFFAVVLPSIRFPLLYTLVLTTAGAFNVYGQPVMMTKGGPNESTKVLMMTIRDLAFGSGPSIAGIAAAMSVLLGLVLMVISAIQFRVMFRSSDD